MISEYLTMLEMHGLKAGPAFSSTLLVIIAIQISDFYMNFRGFFT